MNSNANDGPCYRYELMRKTQKRFVTYRNDRPTTHRNFINELDQRQSTIRLTHWRRDIVEGKEGFPGRVEAKHFAGLELVDPAVQLQISSTDSGGNRWMCFQALSLNMDVFLNSQGQTLLRIGQVSVGIFDNSTRYFACCR